MARPEVQLDSLDPWGRERGITVPLAPVVLRTLYSSLPSGKNSWQYIEHPGFSQSTWLTTEVALPAEHDGYKGFAVVGEDGARSNFGIAIPANIIERKLFCFRTDSGTEELEILEGIDSLVFGEDYGRLVAHKLWHPFLSDDVPMEQYILLRIIEPDYLSVIPKLVAPASLVSGRKGGRVVDRVGTFWYERMPFKYLLGINQPGIHNLWGGSKPRIDEG